MPPETIPNAIVAIDTSVLINLMHIGRLDLAGQIPNLDFVIPAEVSGEILDPAQCGQLQGALNAGWLRELPVAGPAALELYVRFRAVLGKGESACLALAISASGLIACDEKRVFWREAVRHLGAARILNTPGLLLLSIRHGLLSVEEADAAKAVLQRHRFRMEFESFRELLGP